MKDLIEKARKGFLRKVFTIGKHVAAIDAIGIPVTFEKFLNGDDEWKMVESPKGSLESTCIYHSEKGGVFDYHKHPNQVETILVIRGKISCETPMVTKSLKIGDVVKIEENEPHKVIFDKNTTIVIVWHPPLKEGWAAVF